MENWSVPACEPGDSATGTRLSMSRAVNLPITALAGIGFAVGGFRTSMAAEVVGLIVVVTYLIDLLGPALKLPDWFHQIALTSHLGQPMLGQWDPFGIAVCLVLAVGGLAVGSFALNSRDVSR